MEPSEYQEKIKMEDNFSALRVSDKSEDDDIGLSGLRVNVRRQDSSMEEVYLGMFENAKRYM